MELKHYLNGIKIDEPIGFDSFTTKIKRGEYHGMSVEMSVGELEFYGNAIEIINDSYATSIDERVVYEVKDNNDLIYSGILDLSTIKMYDGDYRSISCKVGDSGDKTDFNNNSDLTINLASYKDIKCNELKNHYGYISTEIPKKTILYTNSMTQQEDDVVVGNDNNGIYYKDENNACFLNLKFNGNYINEFGTFEPNLYCAGKNAPIYDDSDDPFSKSFDLDGYVEPLFKKGGDFENKYGKSTIHIDIDATVSVKFNAPFFKNLSEGKGTVYLLPLITKSNCYPVNENLLIWKGVYQSIQFEAGKTNNTTLTFHIVINKDIPFDNNMEQLFFGIRITHDNKYNNETPLTVTLKKGSYVKMTINSDVSNRSNSRMIQIGKSLEKCVEMLSCSKLGCVSDYYCNSQGGGFKKAITTGYEIRGIIGKEINTSFKELIENLSAQDCIGWCFDGNNVRIEPWKWFYKKDVILSITNPKEKTTTINTDYVCSVFNIGYKKYETDEDVKSMRTIHGERTYTSNIGAIAREISKKCSFIADNYSIELTRRAGFQIDKEEEFKYDNNIFVFSGYFDGYFGIVTDFDDSLSNVDKDTYNVKISPAQCAMRWVDFLFTLTGQTKFTYTSGVGNVDVKAIPIDDDEFLEDNNKDANFKENSDLIASYSNPIVVPETLEVTYPISFEQYRGILNNPYGIVTVDGERFWILEFDYSFVDGESKFKLLKVR